MTDSRDVTVTIDRTAPIVFAKFTDPRNLPAWARAANVRPVADGWWTLDTPRGEARIRFHADRATLVVDHEYGDASRKWRVPARIARDGTRSRLTLTLERPTGMTDDAFERQVESVRGELESFRRWLEALPDQP